MSAPFSDITGTTLVAINHESDGDGSAALYFETSAGVFRMTHHQDCCESVWIEEVHGNAAELRDVFVTVAEESSGERAAEHGDTSTWTFYRLQTPKGDLTIRWLGESNGYYSESVDFERVEAIGDGATLWAGLGS